MAILLQLVPQDFEEGGLKQGVWDMVNMLQGIKKTHSF
jgi:hypothetical protein